MRRLLLSCVVFALIAAGCGSSSKGSSASTTTLPPLTKTDFVKQANDICTANSAKVQQAASGITATTSQADEVTLLQTKILPLYRQEVADLQKLSPPPADKEQVAAIFDAVSSALDQVDQKLKTDPKTALSSSYNPFTHADELAKAYGLTACTSGSS